MKKLVSILLALTLTLGLMATVYAAPQPQNIDVEGFIGLDDPSTTIDVTVPSGSASSPDWVVDENSATTTNGLAVESRATKSIDNESAAVKLTVAFVSFTQKAGDAATVAGDLDLFLGGALGLDGVGSNNLSGGYTPGSPIAYTAELNTKGATGDSWNVAYTGEYKIPLTNTSYHPQYELVLNFDIA